MNGQANVLHGVLLPGGTFFSEFSASNLATGAEDLIGLAAGHYQPLFTGISAAKPECTFTTHQVAAALGAFGLFGANLSAGNTDLFLKATTDLSHRVADATTSHHRLRMQNAFGYITRIRARQGQAAECEVRIVPTWDGTNVPLIPAGSVALSGTAAASEWFTLGPIKVNGTTLAGVREWDLDLGCEVEEIASDGDLYTTFLYLKQIVPTLSVRGLGTDWQAAYGVLGTTLSALTAYLRKRATDAGGNVADGTGSHISLTGTNGLCRFGNASGSGNDPADTGLIIRPRASSSSAAVLAASTTATIS